METKHVPEWSIVELPDGRRGVLSRYSRGKYLVRISADFGVELSPNADVRVLMYPAEGMMKLLAEFQKESRNDEMSTL